MTLPGHARQCHHRHQHHPPVHLPLKPLQFIILLLYSCSPPVLTSPITIVLSHPEPLATTAANSSIVEAEVGNSTTAISTYHHAEILQGNNSNNSSEFNQYATAPVAASTTALVKAKATSLPRQEFYLQDKRTGSSVSSAGSANSNINSDSTTLSAKHVLKILENYTPHNGNGYSDGSGVDNISLQHSHGFGYGYGPGDDDYGDRIVIRIDDDNGAAYRVRKLPVVNSAFQFGLLVVIMLVSIAANGCVIVNISRDSLKLKMIHFLLIRHVCVTDFLGTLFILPLPMVAIIRGEWTESETSNHICSVISTTTALFWTMHLIAVALYRTDRVLAVWLPSGRYPICSIRVVNFCLVAVWLTAITGSCLATFTFGYTFQPALALCIPDVPIIFFIVVFSGYCIGLIALSTGYILAFARKRKKKRKGKKEQLQKQMAAVVGAAQRCLLPGSGNHNNNNSSSLVPVVVSSSAPVTHCNNIAVAAEHNLLQGSGGGDQIDMSREEEAFTIQRSDSPFTAMGNHRRRSIVNVLQHQMTGFSDDFMPAPQTPQSTGKELVQDETPGDFYTNNCIRNSQTSPSEPGFGPDPDKTPTPANLPPPPPVFGFGGNVNALPSCTITPSRPSPMEFPDPADDASTADSAEESAITPTAEVPPPPPVEPVVKCPHHFMEEGYQVLLSSSTEDLSSSSCSSSESSSGSSSCMLPGGADGGSIGSGSDKKKILRKKKSGGTGGAAAEGMRRIARITHQSLSLTFNNPNSAPGRVKSAGGASIRSLRRVPTHSKSFDCYYDLLEQRIDTHANGCNGTNIGLEPKPGTPVTLAIQRPHSVHVHTRVPEMVPMERRCPAFTEDVDVDHVDLEFGNDADATFNHDQDHVGDDLEMALVQESHQLQPRSASRTSNRMQGKPNRTPTPNAEVIVENGNGNGSSGSDHNNGQTRESTKSSRSSKSNSQCSSSLLGYGYNNGQNGNGNGTYSNSINTQDEEDRSPYIEVNHDQIDHFRFHEPQHRRASASGRSGSAGKLAAFVVRHSQGDIGKGDDKKKRRHRHRSHRHRHGHGHHGHHRQHHKHGKKSSEAKKRALLSYALSVGHLMLYLPAMFVVGLQGASLPPGAALFCGIVVYCEFLIQPAALMILSHRLRTEITRMITRRPSTLAVSRSNQLI